MGAHIVKNNDEGANDMLKCEVLRRLSLVSNEKNQIAVCKIEADCLNFVYRVCKQTYCH
jgi:hypothetical protein